MKISLLKLFLIFIKIGAILLGGGYVILPIMQSEFSEKRKLVTQEELVNYFALSQSLPGIVAANISMFVGYKLMGKKGAVAGMLGIIFVPFWCIIFLASVLGLFLNNTYLQGAMWGVGVAVTALILLTARELWQNSKRDMFFHSIFLLSLIALLLFKFSPVQTILIFSVIGVLIKGVNSKGVNSKGVNNRGVNNRRVNK
jgi:chromate transporter